MQKKALKNVLEGDSLWYKDAILYELHAALLATVMQMAWAIFGASPRSSITWKI